MAQNGGKRKGAGRPRGISTKIRERQAGAKAMCEALGGTAEWRHIYNLASRKKDYRTMFEIKKYWTDRAEGKAPQSVKLDGSAIIYFGNRKANSEDK